MNIFSIKNLCFSYPQSSAKALDNISLEVAAGSFTVICGKSGSGKTTLVRLLKPALAPHGEQSGVILFGGKAAEDISEREKAEKIGFVLQSPENQTVTDKVWHELAFGAESLGMSKDEIRLRVAEMASYFGIGSWFHEDTSRLSGGQKQILALASVMVMQPEALILDEPTSQLDPVAAGEFISTVARINRDLGVTVIMTEHRLEEVLPLADKIIVIENGKIAADGNITQVAEFLRESGNDMFVAMPAPMRLYAKTTTRFDAPCPKNIREGRNWLNKAIEENPLLADIPAIKEEQVQSAALTVKDIWFRYEKKDGDVLKGTSLTVPKGSIYAVLGGNGSGKSTLLKAICGIKKPYCGKVVAKGKVSLLPQDPTTLFMRNTVREELSDMCGDREKTADLKNRLMLCGKEESHPYDLSGGEQQRLALAKVLLTEPDILLLDEPTKGLDAFFKHALAQMLRDLANEGKTLVIVSHDIEFCAEYSDMCAMLFDGDIVSTGSPREFFSGNSFYTTAINKMSRGIVKNAILVDDFTQGSRR